MRLLIMFAICLSMVASVTISPAMASAYSVEVIGNCPEGDIGRASDINDAGQVIGSYGNNGPTGAFLWSRAAGVIDIWPENCPPYYAMSINNTGLVAGQTAYESPTRAVLRSLDGQIVWPAGLQNALAINSSGVILGISDDGEAVLWADDGHAVTDLASAPEGLVCGGLNDSGQAVITMTKSEMGPGWARATVSAYRWDAVHGVVKLESPFDADRASVWAISDNGTAVGSSGDHAVIWKPDGTVVDLGEGMAVDINNLGQVVMHTLEGAVLWQPDGSFVTLPCLPGSTSSFASAINDNGWIVGGVDSSAAVWIPVPEPSALVALGFALASLGIRVVRRRR